MTSITENGPPVMGVLGEVNTGAQKQTAPPKLDESLYNLTSGPELEFFQRQTGIQDEAELKKHVLTAQKKAYAIYGYPCIRRFAFTQLKISKLPAYPAAVELGKSRPGALFLDIGCCFGNDIRKIVEDGWPVENAIASDLEAGFWDCGHDLFRTTPSDFPAAFVPGNAFDPSIISPRAPFYLEDLDGRLPRPANLKSLKSLTPLQGHISAIHASSFFHLFDEEKQYTLAKLVSTLLSPEPGSMIFGVHGGRPEKGIRWEAESHTGRYMFCHSPESWKQVWEGGGEDGKEGVFQKGTVSVDVGLLKVERPDLSMTPEAEFYIMWWSVTRI